MSQALGYADRPAVNNLSNCKLLLVLVASWPTALPPLHMIRSVYEVSCSIMRKVALSGNAAEEDGPTQVFRKTRRT
jgi:hypothetical protein